MYFWNVNALNDELVQGHLPENEAFKYLMAFTVVYGIAVIPSLHPNTYDIIGAIVDLFITILGVIYIYRCNGGENGSYLIQNFMSLGFVVLIRFMVLVILPASIILYTIVELISSVPEETSSRCTKKKEAG
jgi:hypothetical protein